MDSLITLIKLDTRRITDWNTFHDAFAETFGFPAFYGRNMNAWNDCMSYLDDPGAGMSSVHAPPGGLLVLQLEQADDFASRCPELYAAIVEGSAFVNRRNIECGVRPVLSLAFN